MSIKLLVSVRDANEATVAQQAGADIIDVKEPSQGPLGFAGNDVISAVLTAVGKDTVVSAALGECNDWPLTESQLRGSQTSPPAKNIPTLSYVKLGLASMQEQGPYWSDQWRQVKSDCLAQLPASDKTAWVAVAYSDADRAQSPKVMDVLETAAASHCAVFLLDTFVKDGKTTLDWISATKLTQLREIANRNGMLFALAGQLTSEHLPAVATIRPDIFAVRGAVCEQSERRRSISGAKIRDLQSKLATL